MGGRLLYFEQYFLIYLSSIFLVGCKSIKIISVFMCCDFIIKSILNYYFGWSVYEMLITKAIFEITFLVITLQFIDKIFLKNLFIFCYLPNLLGIFFILTLDHWIVRNDLIANYLFIFCRDIGKYSNEILLTYLLYINRDNSYKGVYWQGLIFCNYIYAIVR